MINYYNNNYKRRYGVPIRALCLILSIIMVLPMGGAASGFVSPVQTLTAGLAGGLVDVANAVAVWAADLADTTGNAFGRWGRYLLSIVPLGAGDEDPETGTDAEPEDPHNLPDVYWNCSDQDVELDEIIIHGGNDENSGADADHPVLTWEKALSLVAPGGVIHVIMEEPIGEDATRNGFVDYYTTSLAYSGESSFFHVFDGAELTLDNLNMVEASEDTRLVHLQGGSLSLGESLNAQGTVYIEQFLEPETPHVIVPDEPDADFIQNLALEFDFDIDDPSRHDGDLQEASYLTIDGARDVVELVEFPASYDASPYINNTNGDHNIVTLSSSLTDENALLYVWKLRTKLGHDNIIEAYLAEKYDGAIYLSGLGDDDNWGLYPDQPVKTYDRALGILMGTEPDSTGPDGINTYRMEHGSFAAGNGVIRICGAPVEILPTGLPLMASETWTMPAESWWGKDNNGNEIHPSYVERYKYYSGALVTVDNNGLLASLTLQNITIKGNIAEQPNATGSIIEVGMNAHLSLGVGALLTENHAENGGGIYAGNPLCSVTINGDGSTGVTSCEARYNGGGIYSNNADVDLIAGTIYDNYALDNGGGIYVAENEVATETGESLARPLTVSGGTIAHNRAGKGGGGIALAPDHVEDNGGYSNTTILPGATIAQNYADQGGGIYTCRNFTLLPTTATQAEIEAVDGCVCAGTVAYNTAAAFGGGWLVQDSDFVMKDGSEIANNYISGYGTAGGGGVALRNSYFLMEEGSSVHNNTVDFHDDKGNPGLFGGGVWCASIPEAVFDPEDPTAIVKYPVDIEIGASISDNIVRSSVSRAASLAGGGIYIGGLAGEGEQFNKVCRVNGSVSGNTVISNYGSTNMTGGGLCAQNVPVVLGPTCVVSGNVMQGLGSASGLGVAVRSAGVTLAGALIQYNSRTAPWSAYENNTYGGGLYVANGKLYMYDGAVQFNTNSATGAVHYEGGGIYLTNTIAMLDADTPFGSVYGEHRYSILISQNTGFKNGGGIYVDGQNSSFITRTLLGLEPDPNVSPVMIQANEVYGSGGGMYVANAAQVNLRSMKFQYNHAQTAGGLYVAICASLNMIDVLFEENEAETVGAMGISGTPTVTVNSCTFRGNQATETNAGAVFTSNADVGANVSMEFNNCRFYGNSANFYGGALYCGGNGSTQYKNEVTLDHCYFGDGTVTNSNNCLSAGEEVTSGSTTTTVYSRGGAIYNAKADLTLKNVSILRNSARYGGGIYNDVGKLELEKGVNINDNQALFGGAIYNSAGEVKCDGTLNEPTDLSGNGVLVGLNGTILSPFCRGVSIYNDAGDVTIYPEVLTVDDVYLYDRTHPLKSYIPPDHDWVCNLDVNVTEGANRFVGGDTVVHMILSSSHDASEFKENFPLVHEAAAAYMLEGSGDNLILAGRGVYIDGIHGNDFNDGASYTRPVRSFDRAKELLVAVLNANPKAEKMIYVVDSIVIDGASSIMDDHEQTWTFEGEIMPLLDEEENIIGTQPIYGVTLQAFNYDATPLSAAKKAMVLIQNGGKLTVESISLDGNRSAFASTCVNNGYRVLSSNEAGAPRSSLTIKNSTYGSTRIFNQFAAIYSENSDIVIRDLTVIENCNSTVRTINGGESRNIYAAGLTLRGGTLNARELTVRNCTGYCYGGGVHLYNATASVDGFEISNCKTTNYSHDFNGWPYRVRVMIDDWQGTVGCGGGMYAQNTDLTLNDGTFRTCGRGGGAYYGGMALAVYGSQNYSASLTATNCSFIENGDRYTYSIGGGYTGLYDGAGAGAVHLRGAVEATMTLCDFTGNAGLYGGALHLETGYTTGSSPSNMNNLWTFHDAPDVKLHGCLFGGSDENRNYSGYAGSAIFSHGAPGCEPQILIDSYTDPETGEVTDSEISYNLSRNFNGAVYLTFTDFTAINVAFDHNRISNHDYYPVSNATAGSHHGRTINNFIGDRYIPGGGAAVTSCGGSAHYVNCDVSYNTIVKPWYGPNSPEYVDRTVVGSVAAYYDAQVTVEGCEFYSNDLTAPVIGNGSNSLAGGLIKLYGAGIYVKDSALTVKSYGTRRTVFDYNRCVFPTPTYTNTTAYNNRFVEGGAIAVINSQVSLSGIDFVDNVTQSPSNVYYHTRGKDLFADNCSVILDDVRSSGGESTDGFAIALNNCSFIGCKTRMEVEVDDIALMNSDTPISLLSPLSGEGKLRLWFDEGFFGKHIVCGYTDDQTETDYQDCHDRTDHADAYVDATGTLDAWDYFQISDDPQFVPAAGPEAQNLIFAVGSDQYAHDIVVKNVTDVFLDGVNGLDSRWDAETGAYTNDWQTDENGVVHDGSCPEKALKTFACAKKALEYTVGGGNIIICGRVSVAFEEHWSLEPVTCTGYTWTPRVLRYMNPDKYASPESRFTDNLILVDHGSILYLDDIIIDGNCTESSFVRSCQSMFYVTNGGRLAMMNGSRLTNNCANAGGAAYIASGGKAEMVGNAVIDHCYVVGSGNGGGILVVNGEFVMNGADCKITDCGAINNRALAVNVYGALAAVQDGGRFRLLNGTLQNACAVAKDTYQHDCHFKGAIYTSGAKYDPDTDTGTLVEIGANVVHNLLGLPSGWSSDGGSVLRSDGGTTRLTGPLYWIDNDNVTYASPGANVTDNACPNNGNFWLNNAASALEINGGLISNVNISYTDLCQLNNGASATVTGGRIEANHNNVFHLYPNSSFTMTGGEIESYYKNARVITTEMNSTNRISISGGDIYGIAAYGVFTYGYLEISGGEIHDFGVNVNAGYSSGSDNPSFLMTGGKLYNSGTCLQLTNNTRAEIDDGEIYGGWYGIDMNSYSSLKMYGGSVYDNHTGIYLHSNPTSCHLYKAEIYDNNGCNGVAVESGSCTIHSDEVNIHHNNCEDGNNGARRPAAIYNGGTLNIYNVDLHDNDTLGTGGIDSGGTLNITGGKFYNNKGRYAGAIRVYGGAPSATIGPAEIYENEGTSGPGGIQIGNYSAVDRTYTLTGTYIHDNKTGGGEGGGGLSFSPENDNNTTSKLYCQEVRIENNKALSGSGRGGGVYLVSRVGYDRQQKMVAEFVDCTITGNSAKDGGGVYAFAGYHTPNNVNAYSPQTTMSVSFRGTTVSDNHATQNGGGLYMYRGHRNNILMGAAFEPMFDKAGGGYKPSDLNHNTAEGDGGGVYMTTSYNAQGTLPVFTAADMRLYLNDTPVSGNEAVGSGGGVYVANKAKVYMNNAEVSGNLARTNGGGFAAEKGGEIYVSQGLVGKNQALGKGNGFYMMDADLKLVNNYTYIDENDEIYLDDIEHPIIMHTSFTKKNSVYNVYPGDQYVPGSIVVKPGNMSDGTNPDASQYLRNFYSIRPGTVIDRLKPYLILGRIVFLDGENGLDPVFNPDGTLNHYQTDADGIEHNGSTPERALKTFKASKAMLGTAPGSVYVCGTVHYRQDNEAEDDVWTLGEKQYLRRYCGFKVAADTTYPAFTGDMFVVEQGELTLENLNVEGSYKADDGFTAAGSVFVTNGETAKLTIKDGVAVKDNVTTANGAGVRIENGEVLMTGGEISGNSTTGKGNAIYQGDRLTLGGHETVKLVGDVYLAAENHVIDIADLSFEQPVEGGEEGETETVTVSALDFAPAAGSYVFVSVENPYDGRDIVAYPSGQIPGEAQKHFYPLTSPLDTMYVVDNELMRPNILELRLPYQVYLDGVAGDDTRDGKTPETAVATIQHAYELIRDAGGDVSGGLIHVVDTVTVADNVTLSSHYVCGAVDVDADGPVSFKRYAQPTAHAAIVGFEKPTNLNPLFTVADGGALTVADVNVDGHSYEIPEGSSPELVSPGVPAQAALVNVEDGGSFTLSGGRLQNASSVGNAGAITVNEGGGAAITGGKIDNAVNEAGVSIYQHGTLSVSGTPVIGGGVYLAQRPEGQAETHIDVPAAFTPADPVLVIPQDAFNGRDIAVYDASLPEPGDTEKACWTVPASILENYIINNNPDDARILELQMRGFIYIDGVNGSDANDGATPETAVLTLKEAYTRLSAMTGGSVIYVVDEVTVSSSVILDHEVYRAGSDEIFAGGDVQFIRYAQPTAYNEEDTDHGELNGYGKESCVSPLLTVSPGVTLTVEGVTFDGHSYDVEEGPSRFISNGVAAQSALLRVEESGKAYLSGGATLQNNSNTLPALPGEITGLGGAIENNGTVELGGAFICDNAAAYGPGVYQNGTMKLDGTLAPFVAADQYVYLTGLKAETEEQKPDEHKIDVTGLLADDFRVTVDFEWPEPGRDAAQFSAGAFLSDVDNEKDHFVLAPGLSYIIIQSQEENEPDTLELADINAFTLEYDGNGGVLDSDPAVTRVPDPDMPYNADLGYNAYDKGTIIPVKENGFTFVNEGETFVAWNTKPDGTGKTFLPGDNFWSDTVGIFENTVLYAVWEDTDREYTVTYKPNNGTEEADVIDGPYHQLDTVTVKFNAGEGGTHFTVPEGKRFIGWNTMPDESGLWYFPPYTGLPGFIPTVTNEDGTFAIAGDIVLYAVYRSTSPYSLTIFKYADMSDMKEPNKTFLFEIEDIYPLSENYGQKYYVYLGTYTDGATGANVPAWIDNQYCYATVTGLPEGKYRVRELTEWSWRYSIDDAYGADDLNYVVSADYQIVVSLTDHRTVTFRNELTNPYYVNGYARTYSNTFAQP